MAKEYNGHRSWNAWNVCLWINNTEHQYRLAQEVCKEVVRKGGTVGRAASLFIKRLGDNKTQDGATYNHLSVKLAIQDIYNDAQRDYVA